MFLRPFGLYCSACFGSLFVSILCTCFSHFFWYCFISFTMFCTPVFCLIHLFFSFDIKENSINVWNFAICLNWARWNLRRLVWILRIRRFRVQGKKASDVSANCVPPYFIWKSWVQMSNHRFLSSVSRVFPQDTLQNSEQQRISLMLTPGTL